MQQGEEFALHGLGGGRVLANDEDGVVSCEGADHFGPFFIVQSNGDGTGVAWRGLEHYLVLGQPDVLQEFSGESRELEVGGIAVKVPVTFTGLDETEFPHVAGKGHLRGVEAHFFQGTGEFFLGKDAAAADEFENLTVAETLGHAKFARRTCAVMSAAWTVSGPVPPGISRVFMPSRGSSRRAISGVNSGAKAARDWAFQSAGFLPLRTLSSTRRPTI